MTDAQRPRTTYQEQLKDPRWQKKRLQVLERDNWTCTACKATDKTLHIDHLCYVPDESPWETPLAHLQTLCETCHAEITQGRKAFAGIFTQDLRALPLTVPGLLALQTLLRRLLNKGDRTPAELTQILRAFADMLIGPEDMDAFKESQAKFWQDPAVQEWGARFGVGRGDGYPYTRLPQRYAASAALPDAPQLPGREGPPHAP
jgi:hypothetical protein